MCGRDHQHIFCLNKHSKISPGVSEIRVVGESVAGQGTACEAKTYCASFLEKKIGNRLIQAHPATSDFKTTRYSSWKSFCKSLQRETRTSSSILFRKPAQKQRTAETIRTDIKDPSGFVRATLRKCCERAKAKTDVEKAVAEKEASLGEAAANALRSMQSDDAMAILEALKNRPAGDFRSDAQFVWDRCRDSVDPHLAELGLGGIYMGQVGWACTTPEMGAAWGQRVVVKSAQTSCGMMGAMRSKPNSFEDCASLTLALSA